MRATAFLRRNYLEVAWGVFAAANVAAMVLAPDWETIPFHFIWVSLTILYGFRVWNPPVTLGVLAVVGVVTGSLILVDAFNGSQLWGELFEVPLMSAMFLAMVWHARRRQDALRSAERESAERSALLERQERFLHDISHELRTPVQIARGHLEVLRRVEQQPVGGIDIALDELGRVERIVERVLLLARAEDEAGLSPAPIELVPFLEDVFMRWAEVAPRPWKMGSLASGTLAADPEALRIALDALLENAVKYTRPEEAIELSARADGDGTVEIVIADGGSGVPEEMRRRIFERFARADAARTREAGGVGLGLAIVDAIARAHGGSCSLDGAASSTFVLRLPGFERTREAELVGVS
ncbi:MAG: HAMP domain-containing histidine kinase [Actinomycetota bacterium]|nr:HAMP domain-containing histidine kinase [Actinomycetota bacterium]